MAASVFRICRYMRFGISFVTVACIIVLIQLLTTARFIVSYNISTRGLINRVGQLAGEGDTFNGLNSSVLKQEVHTSVRIREHSNVLDAVRLVGLGRKHHIFRRADQIMQRVQKVVSVNVTREYQQILSDTPVEKAGRPLNNITKVLLFGYFRGGTSFAGEILSQHPRAFYMFEPLHSLEYQFEKVSRTLLRTAPQQYEQVNSLKKERQIRLIYGILNCKIDYLLQADSSLFKDLSFLFRDRKLMKEVYSPLKCFEKLKLGQPHQKECLYQMERSCSNSSIIAIKENRLRMRQVQELLRLDPDIFVIHYTRDVRGIASSKPYSKITPNSVKLSTAAFKHVSELCRNMKEDLDKFNELQLMHPQRLLRLKYEDLALNTDKTIDIVYKYLGHTVPGEIAKWIQETSSAPKHKRNDPFGIARNSTETAYKWKKTLKPSVHRQISDVPDCAYVLKGLGYEN